MYLRHSTVRKDGKTHTYWRLVRSVRHEGKVVQETVAHLGELDAQGRASARALAEELMGRGGQSELFAQRQEPTERVMVDLSKIRVERSRRFGDVFLGWTLWQALELPSLLGRVARGCRFHL